MKLAALFVIASTLFLGCASIPLTIPTPADVVESRDYEILGEGEGEAFGMLLLEFIPIKLNERLVKAYEMAVQSKGGDRLIDPVITETWFYAYVFIGFNTKVRGTVVKDVEK